MHQPIDIVIPVHNALPYLKTCLEYLEKNTRDFNLILVNDYSDSETTDFVMNYASQEYTVRVFTTHKQQWFTRASNAGLKHVETDLAVLLNSDTVPGEGWLDELCEVYDEVTNLGKKVAVVGSVQNFEAPDRWFETFKGAHGPDYVTGHCWLMDMKAFGHLANNRGTPGRFLNDVDPAQIHIASDRIGCWDLNDIGYTTIIAWKAKMDHHGGKSWASNLSAIPRRIEDVI